jgi:hypothetical protein
MKAQQGREEEKGQTSRKRRGGWIALFLILGVLIVLGVGALFWTANMRRHRASTYGITNPSGSALKVENRSSDFAITRITIADAEERVPFRDMVIEIGVGAETALEIPPGTSFVTVHYVELGQAVPGRPQGSLSESIVVSPGKAVLLSLQGGRSSPASSIFIPPVLALR